MYKQKTTQLLNNSALALKTNKWQKKCNTTKGFKGTEQRLISDETGDIHMDNKFYMIGTDKPTGVNEANPMIGCLTKAKEHKLTPTYLTGWLWNKGNCWNECENKAFLDSAVTNGAMVRICLDPDDSVEEKIIQNVKYKITDAQLAQPTNVGGEISYLLSKGCQPHKSEYGTDWLNCAVSPQYRENKENIQNNNTQSKA